MKYAIITHDPMTATAPTFTFKIEGNKKVGEFVLCNTKRGPRLGRIERLIDPSDIEFTPTATAVKLNASRSRLLSSYDKALIAYIEGERNPENICNIFDYAEDAARASFLYNFFDAWSVKHIWEDGVKYVVAMLTGSDENGEVCGINHYFCLG